MRTRWIGLLGLVSLGLVLSGDSCVVEERTVDIVVTANIPAEWSTAGYLTGGSGTATLPVNAAEDVEDALDKLDEDSTIDSVLVAGACYEVISSSGHNARRTGDVYIDGAWLLHFDVPNNLAGTTGDTDGATLTLKKPGVDLLNSRLDQYLESRNPSLLSFTFSASWTSDPAPTQQDPDSFIWKTCVILQVRGSVTLDVPNP